MEMMMGTIDVNDEHIDPVSAVAEALEAAERRGWMGGIAWALGLLAGTFGEGGTAAMIANEGNYTLDDFKKAGAEKADVDLFRKELRALERQRPPFRLGKVSP